MKLAETSKLVFFISLAMLQGCSGLNSQCSDGVDNDGDGFACDWNPEIYRKISDATNEIEEADTKN